MSETTKLSVRPGDVVIVRHPGRLSDTAFDRLAEQSVAAFPDNKVIVLHDGITIGTVEVDEFERRLARLEQILAPTTDRIGIQ